jgi:hypothetical protein
MEIVTKILVFFLMFSIVITLREGINFLLSIVGNKPLDITKARMWGLGLSISYILTIIFTGFKLS